MHPFGILESIREKTELSGLGIPDCGFGGWYISTFRLHPSSHPIRAANSTLNPQPETLNT